VSCVDAQVPTSSREACEEIRVFASVRMYVCMCVRVCADKLSGSVVHDCLCVCVNVRVCVSADVPTGSVYKD